jgi:hypothetical protein
LRLYSAAESQPQRASRRARCQSPTAPAGDHLRVLSALTVTTADLHLAGPAQLAP